MKVCKDFLIYPKICELAKQIQYLYYKWLVKNNILKKIEKCLADCEKENQIKRKNHEELKENIKDFIIME